MKIKKFHVKQNAIFFNFEVFDCELKSQIQKNLKVQYISNKAQIPS